VQRNQCKSKNFEMTLVMDYGSGHGLMGLSLLDGL
jgi:hypothetical protein